MSDVTLQEISELAAEQCRRLGIHPSEIAGALSAPAVAANILLIAAAPELYAALAAMMDHSCVVGTKDGDKDRADLEAEALARAALAKARGKA